MHKRLMAMKQNLASAIEAQLCNLGEVDCEELGQAIVSSGSKEPRSAPESRRVSLGAHWVD